MTEAEVQTFLTERAKTLIVTSHGPDGYPHVAPMWFAVHDGKIVFRSFTKSQKIVNLRRDPKITVLVEEGLAYDELRGVMIKGTARLVTDEAYCLDLYVELARTFPFVTGVQPGAAPDDEVRTTFAPFAAKNTAVVVEPDHVITWDHRKLAGEY